MASHDPAHGAWWAVALSAHVAPGKVLAVACNGDEIAVFRDASGVVHALEDRCPHRRVLLSDGVVRAGGLQCPYHGWTFDGASGRCTDIPNLRRDESIPAKYKAIAYLATECDGFVHLWLGQGLPDAPALARELAHAGDASAAGTTLRRRSGSAVTTLTRRNYLDVMLDGPQCLLAFPGVRITDFFLGDPHRDRDHLVLDRGAVWQGMRPGPAFVRDHPLIVRTRVPLAAGLVTVDLLDADEQALVSVRIAVNDNRRGTASLCWQGHSHRHAAAAQPLRAILRRALAREPFTVLARLDGAALAALPAAPSLERRANAVIPIHPADPSCDARRQA